MNTDERGSVIRRLLPIAVIVTCGPLWILPGCASDEKKGPATRPSSMRDRQDAALRDPFNYKPDMSRDVSGGDTGHLDRDGLKKDLNNVFNP